MHLQATISKSILATVVAVSVLSAADLTPVLAQETKATSPAQQEFLELRIYRVNDYSKMQKVTAYLENALLPALGRMGLDRVGVFTNKEDVNDHAIFVLIPYPQLETFSSMNATLAKDEAYQSAAEAYFDQPLQDPLYSRIESRLMKAFAGMPRLSPPAQSAENEDRIFELRLYESHTEGHARRKVQMFNEGEIDIMRDCNMGPVFFGETVIGPDMPNLIYMLSASDEEQHADHWKSFLAHPEWLRIKELPQYKDTVSKIRKWILRPTAFSQI